MKHRLTFQPSIEIKPLSLNSLTAIKYEICTKKIEPRGKYTRGSKTVIKKQ